MLIRRAQALARSRLKRLDKADGIPAD